MAAVFQVDTSKPREERELAEFYPDLDEGRQLGVFVVEDASEAPYVPPPHGISPLPLKKAEFHRVGLVKLVQAAKYSKAATDYGFQDPTRPPIKHTATLIRPYALSRQNESIEEVINKKRKLVEYDLDEQDTIYVNNMNLKLDAKVKIPYEAFEILMTELESMWAKLELKISLVESDGGASNIGHDLILTNEAKYSLDDGIGTGPAAEQLCAVCDDSDCDNSNAIVFCDGCNIAVHQECYGVAFIPEGQWFCRKCMINKNREVHCIFCPSTTGAFKQLDSSLWAHVVCALWINELYFANPVYMEPIEGIDLIPKNRWKLVCYICKQKMGACVQCHNKNCFQAYHVTCAKRAGLFMQFTRGVQGAIHNKATLRTFCDRHGPSSWNHLLVLQQIAKARLYFKDLKIINAHKAQLLKKQETDNRLNCFKWKTDNGTPIAPEYFANLLYDKLIELKLDSYNPLFTTSTSNLAKDLGISVNFSKQERLDALKQISFEVCRYWCLKRESKNGAPLTRKNNNMELSSIVYGSKELDEINEKHEFGHILIDDLKKVTSILKDVVDRQNLVLEQIELSTDIFESVYLTLQVLCKEVFRLVEVLDSSKVLGNYKRENQVSLQQIQTKISNLEYIDIRDLENDLRTLCRNVKLENKFSTSIHRVAVKIERLVLDRLNWQQLSEQVREDTKHGRISLPFVSTTENGYVGFKGINVSRILEEEDLSEVENLNDMEEKQLTEYYLTD